MAFLGFFVVCYSGLFFFVIKFKVFNLCCYIIFSGGEMESSFFQRYLWVNKYNRLTRNLNSIRTLHTQLIEHELKKKLQSVKRR